MRLRRKFQFEERRQANQRKKFPDAAETDCEPEEGSPLLETIRIKCITQLLILGALDNIQKKYWNKLKALQKITVLDILFSLLEFASSYNSYTNLRMRMHHIPAERPPLNLLRQELAGTSIYLDVLQKTTVNVQPNKYGRIVSDNIDSTSANEDGSSAETSEGKTWRYSRREVSIILWTSTSTKMAFSWSFEGVLC